MWLTGKWWTGVRPSSRCHRWVCRWAATGSLWWEGWSLSGCSWGWQTSCCWPPQAQWWFLVLEVNRQRQRISYRPRLWLKVKALLNKDWRRNRSWRSTGLQQGHGERSFSYIFPEEATRCLLSILFSQENELMNQFIFQKWQITIILDHKAERCPMAGNLLFSDWLPSSVPTAQ